MTPKFKDEIIDWLNGGAYEWKRGTYITFSKVTELQNFIAADEVRKVDEYTHLREALERGETIQIISRITGKWLDIEGKPSFHYAVDQYRIKPKTKKMVQWLLKHTSVHTPNGPECRYIISNWFYDVSAKFDDVYSPEAYWLTPIKPLPHTEIEVDCE